MLPSNAFKPKPYLGSAVFSAATGVVPVFESFTHGSALRRHAATAHHEVLHIQENVMPYLKSVPGVGLVILCGCTVGGGLPSGNAGLDGAWGGIHVGLTLTTEGGTISYDCAHGTFEAPVRRDREGRFEAIGLHVREHGGPVRVGEVLDSEPARYVGQVTGDHMVLQVLVGSDTLGPFRLQRGAAPQLLRCL